MPRGKTALKTRSEQHFADTVKTCASCIYWLDFDDLPTALCCSNASDHHMTYTQDSESCDSWETADEELE